MFWKIFTAYLYNKNLFKKSSVQCRKSVDMFILYAWVWDVKQNYCLSSCFLPWPPQKCLYRYTVYLLMNAYYLQWSLKCVYQVFVIELCTVMEAEYIAVQQ